MTTISPYYGAYIPSAPPPPPPTPVPTNPDGTPKEVEVVVVWGRRNPTPEQVFGPYGGLTGPQENARKDQNFFFGEGLAGRAEAMGMDANASITVSPDGESELYMTLELNESEGWRNPTDDELYQLIGGSYNRELTASTRSTGRGTELDDYSRALNGLQPRTRWDPETLSPDSLTSIGLKPPGRPHNQREIIGDGLDAMEFARALATKAGFGREWASNSGKWIMNGQGGIATFRGSDRFQVTLRSSDNSFSGVSAVEVKWNGASVKWHVVDK
jgi:hypothetical protein